MEFSSKIIKVHLANYLANLPLPDSFFGIFRLGGMYCLLLLEYLMCAIYNILTLIYLYYNNYLLFFIILNDLLSI